MRRHDTQIIGSEAENLAASLLRQRGFEVRNLNEQHRNYPLYDLVASRDGKTVNISVKCARARRELRLGPPQRLEKLADDSVVLAFLPVAKDREIAFVPGGYELLVIPGRVAREEGLDVHRHYVSTHPGSANHPVMVKDKIDRSERTKSGAVFKRWRDQFLDSWDSLEAGLAGRTAT